jgi:hypothetical protein
MTVGAISPAGRAKTEGWAWRGACTTLVTRDAFVRYLVPIAKG